MEYTMQERLQIRIMSEFMARSIIFWMVPVF